MDFIVQYGWVLWVALILVFVIFELITVNFVFLMLAVGSIGGLIAELVGAPLWVQFIVAAVVSVLLLFTVRPPLLRALKKGGDPARSNVDALIGQSGEVTTAFVGGVGHAKLANGETWTARLSPASGAPELALGDKVIVLTIEGATAIVAPAERTTS
jgi:membrane protein implicated in regulation of membrane protease activity